MTATIPTRTTGAPIPLPAPVDLAAAITRAQTRPAVVTVVEIAPAPTPAPPLHKRRLPSEPIPGEPAAVTRDRLRWVECTAGRHEWADLPTHLGAPVCLHCPIRADQAGRVRDAHRAHATR